MAKCLAKNVRHAGIVVRDMERSLAFYRDLLGLKPVIDFTEQGEFIATLTGAASVRLRMVKLVADNGGMVELLQFLSHPQSPRSNNHLWDTGPTHVAFTVENIDQIYKDWTAKGIEFTCPPQVDPPGTAKVTFCRDPDGVYLELVELLSDPEPQNQKKD
jgi:catechol 2,3-dioxygenase-like lactoylglutathione lyase family enzyme